MRPFMIAVRLLSFSSCLMAGRVIVQTDAVKVTQTGPSTTPHNGVTTNLLRDNKSTTSPPSTSSQITTTSSSYHHIPSTSKHSSGPSSAHYLGRTETPTGPASDITNTRSTAPATKTKLMSAETKEPGRLEKERPQLTTGVLVTIVIVSVVIFVVVGYGNFRYWRKRRQDMNFNVSYVSRP